MHSLAVMLLSLRVSFRVVEKTIGGSTFGPWSDGRYQDIREDICSSFQDAMLFNGPNFLKALLNDVPDAKAYVISQPF